ncbi:uncharacterized protein LOC131008306 [Salvia miltiorrhiza]|uniref:uncharacterized protein LOC131008306 n=1 Tax=Salvia miltiorrhiza TaxID=226208 RepID=UPI0025AD51F4|nr:uncharacterized protein LOC131008306 [Salvia miltiorrhiza]
MPAPHKALVTAWRLLRDRLPTCDNLRKMKITLEEEKLQCSFCHEHSESSNHLFAICSRTQEMWNAIQKWLGVFTARPRSVTAHWMMFCCFGNEKKIRRLLKMVWVGSCWILWKKRNDKRFEGKKWTVEDVILEIKARTWCWYKTFGIFDKEMNFSVWSSEDLISRVM